MKPAALALGCLLLLWQGPSLAGAASVRPSLEQARQLEQAGQPKQAIDLLKRVRAQHPDDERLTLALAWAYLADNNDFWALRVLHEYDSAHPPACQSRALIAWIHLQQANMDQAAEALADSSCASPPEMKARFDLLRARLALQTGHRHEAREYVQHARQTGRFYEEDVALMQNLEDSLDPGHLPLLSWRLELGTGWTSNGRAGSPVDLATSAQSDPSSPIGLVDARLRALVPVSRLARPMLEGQLRLFGLTDSDVSELSYRQPTLRAGVLLGDTLPRLLVNYTYDAVQFAGGDAYDSGPLWFSEAHRGEFELEASERLVAFGGAGRRIFREAGRTRFEAEQGLAAVFTFDDTRLMTGMSARWQDAVNEAYDLFGGTVLAQVQVPTAAGLELRGNLSGSMDHYPRSKGYFLGSDGRVRHDWQLRAVAGVWSAASDGFRLGLDYAFSQRWSTADGYDFTDHRVLLHGTWTLDSDRIGRRVVDSRGRVPMRHAVTQGAGAQDHVRIQDLMRQDEAVRRGSSCLK